ncbi:MAG: glycosyl hydrolase family 65 protein [Clostridia bacterium]|nr:glycosyl hydrolase family 65 protein [Clostridia bacterium]
MNALSSLLGRRFRMIVFDWDGTAVASRHDPVDHLLWRAEALLGRGVWLVVITGTNFDNLNRQFFSKVSPSLKTQLLGCVNRGSEVYGFTENGAPVRRHARIATGLENRLMDQVGEMVRRHLMEEYGLETRIIADRMNRRKLDIIPMPGWQDPRKEDIGELLAAVDTRLRDAGVPGIRHVLGLVQRYCCDVGLDARITTDVKHIEYGLTDKSDSAGYILDQIRPAQGMVNDDVLFIGDEFGPVGGFEGSDHRMLVGQASGASFVSVGREPSGVPEGVRHIGGGVPSFVSILDEQRRLWRPRPIRQSADDLVSPGDKAWSAWECACNARNAAAYETMFTVANGYMGTRGAHEDGLYRGVPVTFVAGLFDQAPGDLTELVVIPDWLPVRLRLDGRDVIPHMVGKPQSGGPDREGLASADGGEVFDYSRALDVARGVLRRTYKYRSADGRVLRVESERFASIASPHMMHMSYQATMEKGTGMVTLSSILDGDVANSGAAHLAIDVVDADSHGDSLICGTTLQSGIPIVMACSARAYVTTPEAARAAALATAPAADRAAEHDFQVLLSEGSSIVLEKHVAVYTGRDADRPAHSMASVGPCDSMHASAPGGSFRGDLIRAARLASSSAAEAGFHHVLTQHAAMWAGRWAKCDVQVDGPERDQLGIRFAMHHLMACASDTDETVSIPAKGLHGEGYRGHIFWDTEIFAFPFFAASFPKIARNLLMYRYGTLPGARRKARENGYRGAMFAWESADTGDETTPKWSKPHPATGERTRIWCGDTEDHVTADVAYAVTRYWRWTGDNVFMREHGAEMVIEAARFWAARASWSAEKGRYEYLRVIGPDEYHENVNNNAFTNYMAHWTIRAGLAACSWLRRECTPHWEALARRIGLEEAELEEMQQVGNLIHLPEPDPFTRLIEQFEGYCKCDHIDLTNLNTGGRPVESVLGHDAVAKSDLVKQADLLMLARLLPGLFDHEVWQANWDFYEPRTAHGSSLSPSLHAALACKLGSSEDAYRYLQHAISLDLSDHMGNLNDGIHCANLGGIWQAAVFGFAGIEVEAAGECGPTTLRISPRLPDEWDRIEASIELRGRQMRVAVTRGRVELALEASAGHGRGHVPAPLLLTLNPGEAYPLDEIPLEHDEEHGDGQR